jgi:hypothetical protein
MEMTYRKGTDNSGNNKETGKLHRRIERRSREKTPKNGKTWKWVDVMIKSIHVLNR